jgi:hypothetical protein
VTVHLLPHRSDYIISVDGTTGAPQQNGSWTGLLGMIMKGEIQVADMPLVMSPERESIVDFTFPFADTKYMSPFLTLHND